ncbi:hypothetical protein [uncultured Thiohalocapsa sp.]|uniref:hypothetical protein n=1 Tax=uncultured Thiohalocapsa sp. TaxID=768990 RepID=UPI0025D61163|nr:hypothetical protein [uncultured Thiohalocapsa sp.]
MSGALAADSDTDPALEATITLGPGTYSANQAGWYVFFTLDTIADVSMLKDGVAAVDDNGLPDVWSNVVQLRVVSIPAAAWLFGSALIGMAGVGYRRSRRS